MLSCGLTKFKFKFSFGFSQSHVNTIFLFFQSNFVLFSDPSRVFISMRLIYGISYHIIILDLQYMLWMAIYIGASSKQHRHTRPRENYHAYDTAIAQRWHH